MNCIFEEPINLGAKQDFDWEFSKMVCQDEHFELVQNPTYPDREFYAQKTLTYGEAIIIWFLTLFTIFMIGKTIFNFFWKEK